MVIGGVTRHQHVAFFIAKTGLRAVPKVIPEYVSGFTFYIYDSGPKITGVLCFGGNSLPLFNFIFLIQLQFFFTACVIPGIH